jgi:MoaA/NifB/PqqE/SkfB family radical SAM enzyme
LFKKIKIALGIITGRVFTGPLEVAVDITNGCTVGCMPCWFYSPLRTEKMADDWTKGQMSFDLFRRIVDELKDLEVKKIMLGGDGDPFMHPRIIEMIEYSKKAGLVAETATCGIYFDDGKLRKMFDSGLDALSISILAATPQVYVAMHPSQNEGIFDKIKRSLLLLSKWKKEEKRACPYIRLIDVICRLNYFEADRMIDLANEVDAEEVAFKRLATRPFTDSLLLNEAQLRELDEKLEMALARASSFGIRTNITEFERQTLPGLATGNYTLEAYSKIPCYIGWTYARILCDGSVVPCCGCHNYIIGNLRDRTLKDIWHSKEYDEFRKESINIRKDHSIAGKCNCHSCVHYGMNLGIYRSLHFLKRDSHA